MNDMNVALSLLQIAMHQRGKPTTPNKQIYEDSIRSRDNRMREARYRRDRALKNPSKYGTEADCRHIRHCVKDARSLNRYAMRHKDWSTS